MQIQLPGQLDFNSYLARVAVLFARSDSVYKSISGLDVYDECRNALTYSGSLPVIAHPPCRGWGRLRHLAKVSPGELELPFFAIDVIRRCGGVLEHPASSRLWIAAYLPAPGTGCDSYGGFTFPVYQSSWGHRAPKATWLYIVGVSPFDLPVLPFELGFPPGRIESMGTAEREKTPFLFAEFLVDLASRCEAGFKSGSYVTPGQCLTGWTKGIKS